MILSPSLSHALPCSGSNGQQKELNSTLSSLSHYPHHKAPAAKVFFHNIHVVTRPVFLNTDIDFCYRDRLSSAKHGLTTAFTVDQARGKATKKEEKDAHYTH